MPNTMVCGSSPNSSSWCRRARSSHAPHGVEGEDLALLHQLEEFGEDPLGERVVSRGTGDGDLVAPHVDVAGERALDELEHVVAGAEQVDHLLVVGDRDLRLNPRAASRGGAGGWAGRHGSATRACGHLSVRVRYVSPWYRPAAGVAGYAGRPVFRRRGRPGASGPRKSPDSA